ncbi:hypothetical protein [Aminipila terrae]|uniref:hypothetical protein n=1 Tax=Aminipila terrae TaxID=2697030 RepID=UPI001FABFA5E|nr:hypothetical protein [Aminipila terrae]
MVFNQLVPEPIDKITMLSDFHYFHADVPGMEYAAKIATEARKEAGIDGKEWLKEVKRLNDEKISIQSVKKEIQYFFINNGCICGISDEPMCEIALDIRSKAKNQYIFFGGYMNGYEGYLASAEEYDKGGYEVLWSNLIYFKYFNRVMSFNRDTAGRLADITAQKCKRLLK